MCATSIDQFVNLCNRDWLLEKVIREKVAFDDDELLPLDILEVFQREEVVWPPLVVLSALPA